ncbi:transposable element Tcb2 transposase [Trichonephila clavipes]|nr:transposable element Tcb2 transposase [Trichonephila clavipes]
MAKSNHLDDFTRGRMIGKLEEGRIVTSVAAELGINKSVVSRFWKAFQATAVRKVGGGRPRTTTAEDDLYIILQAKRGQRQSGSVIAQQLYSNGATSVAVYCGQHLHKGGLFARRPERCLPLAAGKGRYHSNGLASVLLRFKSHRTCVGMRWGRCIVARLHHPEKTQQLKQMLIEEWVLLPQEMLHQLVLSMRRRCEETIAVRRAYTILRNICLLFFPVG